MCKRITALLLTVILIALASVQVEAAPFVPYKGYEYNSSDESVPAPVGYEPETFSLGGDIGCTTGPTLVGFVSDANGGDLHKGLLCAAFIPLLVLAGIAFLRTPAGKKNP